MSPQQWYYPWTPLVTTLRILAQNSSLHYINIERWIYTQIQEQNSESCICSLFTHLEGTWKLNLSGVKVRLQAYVYSCGILNLNVEVQRFQNNNLCRTDPHWIHKSILIAKAWNVRCLAVQKTCEVAEKIFVWLSSWYKEQVNIDILLFIVAHFMVLSTIGWVFTRILFNSMV